MTQEETEKEAELFQDLINNIHRIVNNEKFKIFCNPNSLTYEVPLADVERVILAYGLMLNGGDMNED